MVVAQPMAEMPGRPLYVLTEAGGSVMGVVLSHMTYSSTVEMPPLPTVPLLLPLHQILPVPLPPLPLPPIPYPCTTLPQLRSPVEISMTR